MVGTAGLDQLGEQATDYCVELHKASFSCGDTDGMHNIIGHIGHKPVLRQNSGALTLKPALRTLITSVYKSFHITAPPSTLSKDSKRRRTNIH